MRDVACGNRSRGTRRGWCLFQYCRRVLDLQVRLGARRAGFIEVLFEVRLPIIIQITGRSPVDSCCVCGRVAPAVLTCGKSRRQRIDTLGYIDASDGVRYVRSNSSVGETV